MEGALNELSEADRARIESLELTKAELAELYNTDERLWGLWLYETDRIRSGELGHHPEEMRRDLRWGMVLCLATIDPDGPWQRCLDRLDEHAVSTG